tara:strand:+ start:53 stop:286 length:234 start_codon:yes stop_codon:yes gene_type:complete
MKLKKEYSGYYKGESNVKGYNIRLEVSSIDNKGFSFSYYVNNSLVYDDGWYGLRLKDIKRDILKNIENCIEDYELER